MNVRGPGLIFGDLPPVAGGKFTLWGRSRLWCHAPAKTFEESHVKPGLAPVLFAVVTVALGAACGPSVSSGGDDTTGDDAPDVDANNCSPVAEVCDNSADEDCDGYIDCEDVDCFGVGECPDGYDNCGEADVVEGEPLALPDGVGTSYESSINITGFTDGQFLEQATDFLGICVVMEHSWLRDLQIEMDCPSGVTIVLQEFLGQTGSEIFMGQPNDTDGTNPVPGVGAEYCWTPTATNLPMLEYVNANPTVHDLPPGDYQPSSPFNALEGCTLNGEWTLRVTDLWGIDNGFIFSWGISFDPAIIEDCEDWPVE